MHLIPERVLAPVRGARAEGPVVAWAKPAAGDPACLGGPMAHIEITRNDDGSRYEATVDGALAGFAEFALTEHAITFTHTEVDPAFEGQGVGSALARGALDDAIHRGDRRIKVVCPFIRAWVERHPDYQELLEPSRQS